MDNPTLDENGQNEINNLHGSVRFSRRNNNLTIEETNQSSMKRSSSMSLNYPKNFVPKLKPIPTIICPSPINLDQKFPPPVAPEIQNTTISTLSFDSQNEFNLKPIKYIYSRKTAKKKSFKILNIEEEAYALSDWENNSKKMNDSNSDSDYSKSDEENNNNIKNKFKLKNKLENLRNINIMRKKMAKLRKSFNLNENLLDDSNINKHFVGKRLNQYQNIRQRNFIKEIRTNKNFCLKPIKMIKYRTKSFSLKPKYVSTILGFLEKTNSTNSLNSNGK